MKKLIIILITLGIGNAMPTYTIKPGDTLYRISKATGYSVDELANYNRIDPNMIRVGQQLSIPYRYPGAEMSEAVPTSRAQVVDLLSPEERALLNTISFAEGTKSGYGTLFGGKVLPELEKGQYSVREIINMSKSKMLPNGKTPAGYGKYKGKESGATGKYQLMGKTIEDEARIQGIDLDDKFTPELQDRIMINRIKRFRNININDLKNRGLTQDILDKLAKEFASFPYSGEKTPHRVGKGKSYYDQPTKPAKDIIDFYNRALIGK